MNFWGVEAAAGKGTKIDPAEKAHDYIHVSQVALGTTAKENERHVLMVSTGELKNIILGTLIKNKCDQIQLDLVFEKEFILSHTGSGSICYSGYGTQASTEDYDDEDDDDEDDEDEDEEDEEDVEMAAPTASLAGSLKDLTAAIIEAKGKKVKTLKQTKKEEDVEEEEEEEKEAVGRKRVAAAKGTPVSTKKAKLDQSATPSQPAPSTPTTTAAAKQTPGEGGKASKKPKSELKTPKAGSTPTPTLTPTSGKKLTGFSCTPCTKSFANETALAQHNKSKHEGDAST